MLKATALGGMIRSKILPLAAVEAMLRGSRFVPRQNCR
jgi:hypothetical protein